MLYIFCFLRLLFLTVFSSVTSFFLLFYLLDPDPQPLCGSDPKGWYQYQIMAGLWIRIRIHFSSRIRIRTQYADPGPDPGG